MACVFAGCPPYILYNHQCPSTEEMHYAVILKGGLGSRVVSVLDSGAEGPRFKSQSRRCRVTVLGKLFTPISKIGSSPLKGCGVTAGLVESNGSLPSGL